MKRLKKVADFEKETRVYEITSSPETLDKLEQLLVDMMLLGNIGASRSFNVFVDGDGSFHIKIEKKNGKLMKAKINYYDDDFEYYLN